MPRRSGVPGRRGFCFFGSRKNLGKRSRRQAAEAGVAIINDIDRNAFESATKFLIDESRADPKLRPLIERIQAAR